jgi:DNA polymerase alpha subunit A
MSSLPTSPKPFNYAATSSETVSTANAKFSSPHTTSVSQSHEFATDLHEDFEPEPTAAVYDNDDDDVQVDKHILESSDTNDKEEQAITEPVVTVTSAQEVQSAPKVTEKEPGFEVRRLDTAKKAIGGTGRGFVPKFQATAKSQVLSSASNVAGCKSWTSVADEFAVAEAPASQPSFPQSSSQSGDNDFLESDGSLLAYWFDAFEKDGTIFLFAKVLNKRENKYVGCCITIEEMNRVLFVLPRSRKVVGKLV